MTNDKKAALYIRVSTRYQVDKDSLPFQRKKLKEYCKLMGIQNYEIFEDDGFSGKNTDRPEYQKMMTELRSGKLSHIIVWKVDRISRNLLDFAAMYAELKKYRTVFISMNEQFDTSSAIGEAMLKIILVFAELERNMTSERVTSIMINRAENGLWNGARMPIGYKWDDKIKYPIPDEEEAKTVQYIFDKYENTHSCLEVSRILNNNHIKTKRGGEWTSKVINDVIRNPFYIGTYRYNRRASGRGPLKPQNEWIVKENNHEAIISKEQFDRCNAIMDFNAKRDTSELRQTKHIHVFSGRLKCAECGAGFVATKDKARANGYRPSLYRCGRRARMMDCDAKTISDLKVGPFVFNYISNIVKLQKNISTVKTPEQLEKALLNGSDFESIDHIQPDGLHMLYRAITYKSTAKNSLIFGILSEQNPSVDTAEIDLLIKERDKHKKAIERLLDVYLYDDNIMSKSELTDKRKALQQKVDDLDNKINSLTNTTLQNESTLDTTFIKKASAFLVSQKILSEDHIDYVKLAMELDPEILKDFIRQIIDTIEINKGQVSKIKFINGIEHKFTYK